MRLTKRQIEMEIMNNLNIYQITPSWIIQNLSLSEFQTLVMSYEPTLMYCLRIKALEQSFVALDRYENAAIIRDFRIKHFIK